MKAVVKGRFAAGEQAARAVDRLLHSCISAEQVHTFFLSPAHATDADRMSAKRYESWSVGPEKAIELDVGPAAAADGVQISAYVGTLREDPTEAAAGELQTEHDAEILVAVETSDHVSQVLALNVLEQHGARGIERAAGGWHEEERHGFHPVPLSTLLERSGDEKRSRKPDGITWH